MEMRYFKLDNDLQLNLFDNVPMILKKNAVFHVQDIYKSPTTGESMVVIAMDKAAPVAVPESSGSIIS
jgi:hypothetical protein